MQTIARRSSHFPSTIRTYDELKVRFSAMLGEEPEVEVTLVQPARLATCAPD